jgi:predicted Zn-dependent protease
MFFKSKISIFLFTAMGLLFSCTKNPFTGKNTFNIVSNNQLFPSAFQQYSTFLQGNKVIVGTPNAIAVQNVGTKIKSAAELWLKSNGYLEYLNGYQWEYKLIDNKEINAWCMPGGKIVVYSGIMSVTKDEAGLATVMGHEVAHALANHGAQRMSAVKAQELGALGISLATSNQTPERQDMWQHYYGLGSEFGAMLPFSRNHENEADKIGLILMAIAGYNPEASVAFWERMSAASGGNKPPEFFSTHPADATRIENLKKNIPLAKAEALKYRIKLK